jgi:hypothetical protein
MSVHTIRTEVEVAVGTNPEDITYEYPILAITFDYTAGYAASWDEPGCDAEVSLRQAVLVSGGEDLSLSDRAIQDLADDYLNGDGYYEAYARAREDIAQCRASAHDYEGRL